MSPFLKIAAAHVVSVATLLAGETYYTENFRNYGPNTPVVAPGVSHRLENDPIWSQRASVVFTPKADGPVFVGAVPAVAPDNVTAFDVQFDFSFMGEGDRFDLRINPGAVAPTVLTLTPTSASLTHAGKTAEGSFAEMSRGQWRTCVVQVREGKISVLVEDAGRGFGRVLELPTGLTLSGINFHATNAKPFALTNIIVRKPAPLPDHGVERLLPSVIDDSAAYTSGATQSTVRVPAADVFGATVRIGKSKPGVEMTLTLADGRTRAVVLETKAIKGRFNENDSAKRKDEDAELADAIIHVKGIGEGKGGLDYHVRPLLRRYFTSYSYTDAYHDIVREWEKLPAASAYPLTVEFRKTGDQTQLFLNGSLAQTLPSMKEVSFHLAPDASFKDVVSRVSDVDTNRYLPLDVAAQRMARAMANANPSIAAGARAVEGVPMRVAPGSGSADVGLTREGQGNWALEVDEYLARSAFDGLLTEIHFSVPSAVYHRAWVLCAVDPDPSKDPVLTTRLTRYGAFGIGNNLIADTTLTLPRADEPLPEGVRRVGTVEHAGRTLPLYLVRVPIDVGRIIDLAAVEEPMNVDFFGKPWANLQQIDNTSKPDPDSTSAVQIFAATLEKSPMTIQIKQSQPGNVFHDDERPVTTAIVRSLAPAKGSIAWEIRDVEGRRTGGGEKPVRFDAAGREQAVEIDLAQDQLGWYELLLSLRDADGNVLLTHPARFALLGTNTRQASYESPFGTWWFDGTHNTPAALEFGGPIMFKAGIRKAAWTKQSEADMSRWGITQDQVNMPFDFKDLKEPEKAKVAGKKKMDDYLAKYPHLREVLIFHESGPGNDVPVELFGVQPETSDARVEREKKYAELFNFAGAFFREHYPHLKTVVGNNSASVSCIAAIFRHGGKPQYMDYIGIESPSQVIVPEKLQEWAIQGHHMASDTAEVLGGKRIPATGCYEFTYRCERDMGEQQQAEWYTRDALISLANGFTRIGPGILFDTANSYYNGLWGGSGILQRGPWGYPKKSYVAYATLTKVMDRVKLRRQIPTGSTTVYAVAFDRADGKIVTALWASRGEADFWVTTDAATRADVIDMYGRSASREVAGAFELTGGTSPVYLVTDAPIASVEIAARRFPKDAERATHAKLIAALATGEEVTLEDDRSLDTPLVAPLQTPVRQHGDFELESVRDPEKADVIELTLKPTDQHESKYLTRYATIRLNAPARVEGDPAALGVWVKGDSNWGRVLYQIRDAEGEVWTSTGTGGWGCDILDWPGHAAVNFDGWNFVSLPLRDSDLYNDHSPGPVQEQWVSGGGNKRIDLPIEVTGLIVEMNRTKLDLIDFKPALGSIRLTHLSSLAAP